MTEDFFRKQEQEEQEEEEKKLNLSSNQLFLLLDNYSLMCFR